MPWPLGPSIFDQPVPPPRPRMTPDLVALAILAIDDLGARDVLEDACLERLVPYSVAIEAPGQVLGVAGELRGWTLGEVRVEVDGGSYRWKIAGPSGFGPGDPEMRALVAALLFGEWSEWAWPLVRQTVQRGLPPPSPVGTARHLYEMVRWSLADRGHPNAEVEITSRHRLVVQLVSRPK